VEDGYNVDNRVEGSAANVVQSGSIGVMNLNMDRFALPVPAQLPSPVGTLVNQKHVLAALDDVLDRLNAKPVIVVLVGARGSGKSTAAVYWLQHHDERFPDGQLRADLGAWADHAAAPSEVLLGFITSLGVKQADVPADLESRVNLFRSLTRGRSLQILLDDAVTAAQVKSLLPGPGRSMVVVTGQGGFGALAELDATFIDVEPLEEEMAIELLRVLAGDRVDAEPDARAALVELCGGRAVALSVVGRVLREAPDLLVSELLEELEFGGGITGVTVDGEPAIAAVLDAGYRRLSEPAQRVYRTLGLHPGREGATIAALAAVLKTPEPKLRPILRELVEGKRMVDKIDGRFRLDALVREHARNIAHDVDGSEVCELRKRAFVAWYVTGAVAVDAVLQPARPWMRSLFPDVVVATEHPALRQPREWMLAERGTLRSVAELADALGELEALLRLCVAQWWLYESEKCSDDLVATHVLGVQAAEHLGNLAVKALLLVQQGYAERTRLRFDEAARLLAEGEVLAQAQGSVELEATAVEGAGLALFDQGDLAGAQRLLNRNVGLAEHIGDLRRTSLAYMHAAKPAAPAEASRLLAEAWTGFRTLGRSEQHNLGKVLLWQGRKFGEQGDLSEAQAHLDRALALMTEIGREFDRGQILDALGDVHLPADPATARRYYAQAAQVYEKSGHLVAAARSQQRATGDS